MYDTMFSIEFFPTVQEAREWIRRCPNLIPLEYLSAEIGSGTVRKFKEVYFERYDSDEISAARRACVVFRHKP